MDENRENNDSAGLKNIVHFLKDISAALSSMVSWMRPDTREGPRDEVRAEHRVLHEYLPGIFKTYGNRTTLACVPAST
jgi:hypothetical protein